MLTTILTLHIFNLLGTTALIVPRTCSVRFATGAIDLSRSSTARDSRFELFYDALLFYRSVYGHLNVPHRFQVPCNSTWPTFMTGIKLGNMVSRVRTRGDFKDKHGQLEELGLKLNTSLRDSRLETSLDKTVRALKVYNEIYGDTLVPALFVVPSDFSCKDSRFVFYFCFPTFKYSIIFQGHRIFGG